MLVHGNSCYSQTQSNQAWLWLWKMDRPALVSSLEFLGTVWALVEFHSTAPPDFECCHLRESNGTLPSFDLVILLLYLGTGSCHSPGILWTLWNWTCLWAAQWCHAEKNEAQEPRSRTNAIELEEIETSWFQFVTFFC